MNVYVARQPIFDKNSTVVAYELLYRDTNKNIFNSDIQDSVATSVLLLNSYLGVGLNLLTDDKKGYINFGPHLIMDDIPQLLSHDRIVIELLETVVPNPSLIKKLKKLKKDGYTIALDDYIFGYPYDEIVDLVDIVKVDFRDNTPKQIRQLTGILKSKNKILLAEKVETFEQFDWARKVGYTFFQGFFFSKPVMVQSKKLNGITLNYTKIQLNNIS